MHLFYLWMSPYSISKRFLKKRGEENIYSYGETPLTTLDLIAKECRILSKDHVFELGCGRGRSVFWLHAFIGCRVTGIDVIPTFIERAMRIKQHLRAPLIDFKNEDMRKTNFDSATVIYFYGIKLQQTFSQVKTGTKIITVSAPLTGEGLRLEKQFKAQFPWGVADVFLNVRC